MKKQAFTLVELIVVITILAILGTLAFMSFQGYAQTSRDSVRLSDLTTISKALEFERTKNDFLPLPDDAITLTASGEIIGYQGYASTDMLGKIGISSDILDPLDGENYIYVTDNTKTEYQLLGYLEGELSGFGILRVSADKTTRNALLKGKEIGVIVKSDTEEAINRTFSGSSFDYYTSDNNHKVLFGRASKDQIVFSDTNREELAYYNKRSCRALYNYGSYDGSKIYDIYPEGVKVEAYCDMANGGGEVRNFRTFDGLNDYVKIPEVTADGDFELEVDVLFIDTGGETIFSGTDQNTNTMVMDIHNGQVRAFMRAADGAVSTILNTPVSSYLDNGFHRLRLVYQDSNSEASLYIDEELIESGNWMRTGDETISFLGRRGGTTRHLKGMIANVNFKSGWTQAGIANANPYYKLDDSDNIAQNSQVDILEKVAVSSINNVTQVGNKYNFALTQYGHIALQTPAGFQYLIEGIINNSTLTNTLRNNDNSTYPFIARGDGKFKNIITGTTPTLLLYMDRYGQGEPMLTVSDLNVYKAPGYGVYNNFGSGNIEQFTQDIDGNWLGKELWSYGDYTYLGSEDPFDLLIGVGNSSDITIGSKYYWKWKQELVGDTMTRLRVGISSTILYQTTTGEFSNVVTAQNDDLYLQGGANPSLSTGTRVSDITVRRFIENIK